ncbi:hypothetical protein B0H14DRAFT_3477626 [Mycena olivaceomarginata]|nr:hypothetical protein B0H14DRAFT_3477626 [Mycena olivaceomarginata]
MSASLAPRGQCTACAHCAAWVVMSWSAAHGAIVPRHTPSSPQEACECCQHPYISHQAPAVDPIDRNYPCRRGGCIASHCGGFTSAARSWEVSTLCVCGRSLGMHSLLEDSAVQPVPLPAVLPPVLRPPTHGSLVGAMDGFSGVPAPVPGLAANANHSGPRHRFPNSTTSAGSNQCSVCVVIWPMVLPGEFEVPGYASNKIVVKNEYAGRYADALQLNDLVFHIQVPAQGPMPAAEFSRQLEEHLAKHNLSMPPCPPGVNPGPPNALHSQLWILLQATVRSGVYTLVAHPTINDPTFGYPTFKKTRPKVLQHVRQRWAPVRAVDMDSTVIHTLIQSHVTVRLSGLSTNFPQPLHLFMAVMPASGGE